MASLPPPPDPVDPEEWLAPRARRPGELTPGWRVVYAIAWSGVVLAFAAVWKSSRTLGLSTWWLGPSSDPNLLVVQLLPFVAPVAVVAAAMRNVRHLPELGIGAAALVAAIAAGDIDRVTGIAVVEFAVAGAGLLVSAAAFAGVYRRAPVAPVGLDGEARSAVLAAPDTSITQ